MRRIVFISIAALSSVVAMGQGLLDCVEPDVLHALLLQNQGERAPVITAEVPAEVMALKMPREFTWVGSAERVIGRVDATTNASQVTAAWRTDLATDAARAATVTALAASGWEVRDLPAMGMGVFVSPAMQLAQPACRDGDPVNFIVTAMDGVSYVLVTIQRGNPNSICSQPARFAPVMASGTQKYLPRLEMPLDPATGAVVRVRSSDSSSSGGSASARAEFTSQDSPAGIAKHFAQQMQEQGWTNDATWSGAATAGSSWSRAETDTVFQGTLLVTDLGEGQFTAFFRVMGLR